MDFLLDYLWVIALVFSVCLFGLFIFLIVKLNKQEKTKSETPKTEIAKKETNAKVEKTTNAESKVETEKTDTKEETYKVYRIIYNATEKVWEIRKTNAKRVIRKVKTKAEALQIAKKLSSNQELNMAVHKKNGKFQKK